MEVLNRTSIILLHVAARKSHQQWFSLKLLFSFMTRIFHPSPVFVSLFGSSNTLETLNHLRVTFEQLDLV